MAQGRRTALVPLPCPWVRPACRGDRIMRRSNRIRKKLGWPAGIFNGNNLGKSKGMHWRTYEQLCQEHDVLESQIMVGLVDDLERLTGRKFMPD